MLTFDIIDVISENVAEIEFLVGRYNHLLTGRLSLNHITPFERLGG
ncbi:hypothetical protein CHELA17_64811 [Chelatococcus asaccharovorans]|nr:hypothetical protein CHELA17_64811 [Chelatococcus asaccharovorans]